METFLGNGNPQIKRGDVGSCRGRIETQLEGTGVCVGSGNGGEEQTGFGMRGGPADLLESFVCTIADELRDPVNNHLRSVDAAVGENVGVLLLTTREIGRGKGIGPAEVVPVIDVLFESEDFDAVDGLIGPEFFEERIRRRTTGAALGGKEFEDNGLLTGEGT